MGVSRFMACAIRGTVETGKSRRPQSFRDPILIALVRRVATENLDLQIAATRLEQARAQVGAARAAEFPKFGSNASYNRQKASDEGQFGLSPNALGANGAQGNTAGGTRRKLNEFDVFQFGVDASWEIDFWGGVKRSVEAAAASLEVANEARRAALLTSLAEVARDYIVLRGVQAQIGIARDNIRIAQQSLNLTRQRAAGGLTTDLDVANASAQLRNTRAQIPKLEQQEAALINALGLLLGHPPNTLRAELATVRPVPPVPPRAPIGAPSELARRRPDIRQAEAQLHAATAVIGVAIADFYPSFKLGGSFGLQSITIGHLFDLSARQYAAGGNISVPLFEGGRLKATLQLREAQEQESAIQYQKTILQAWHEVDNALTAYQLEQIRREELAQAASDSKRALGLAQDRYGQGVADFLTVLDAQRNLLNAQLQMADSTTTVSTNLVTLYKALGGGWEADLPDEGPPAISTEFPKSNLLER
jgi:NodT family efflux transporter outer membrane factor (OMF) lipoprotein